MYIFLHVYTLLIPDSCLFCLRSLFLFNYFFFFFLNYFLDSVNYLKAEKW